MKFNSKDYKILKLKNYIKINHLFFFVNGVSINSIDWIKMEQTLKNYNYFCYKVLNKITSKTLKNSIYFKTKPVIQGITFFVSFQSLLEKSEKKNFLKTLELLDLNMLGMKLNNKIYSVKQFEKLNSLGYIENKLLLYKFIVTNLKIYNKF